jgi:hypothetical protein
MIEWTKEKIAEQSNDQIKALRENAEKHNRQDIVELCIEELLFRKPRRSKKSTDLQSADHTGQYVSEFHFVCPNELGVTHNEDGTIWTGTWVVAEEHAESAVRYGAQVALHSLKSERSYLNGTVMDWRKRPRETHYTGDQETQTKEGIDFLVKLSDKPLTWAGDGSGEKGYSWRLIVEASNA